MDRLSEGGAQSIREATEEHRDAIAQTGVGTLYGSVSDYRYMNRAQRAAWRSLAARPGTRPEQPRLTSCIHWSLEHVGAAYAAAGRSARFQQIRRAVVRDDMRGATLARELQKDGWVGIQFLADESAPPRDPDEAAHARRGRTRGRYHGLRVADRIAGYRGAGGPSAETADALRRLDGVKFWFGIAKGGEHTFVGSGGTVSEVHWDRGPDAPDVMEESPFVDYPWPSGMIFVPPSTWITP